MCFVLFQNSDEFPRHEGGTVLLVNLGYLEGDRNFSIFGGMGTASSERFMI